MCKTEVLMQGRLQFGIRYLKQSEANKNKLMFKWHLSIKLNCLQRKFRCQGYKDSKRHYLITLQLNKEDQKGHNRGLIDQQKCKVPFSSKVIGQNTERDQDKLLLH